MARKHHITLNGADSDLPPPEFKSRKEFGTWLGNRITSMGINRSEFGRMAGIERGPISDYVNGKSYPSTENLVKISRVLDLPEGVVLPNAVMSAIGRDPAALSVTASESDPETAVLQINQLVPTSIIPDIMRILQENRIAQNRRTPPAMPSIRRMIDAMIPQIAEKVAQTLKTDAPRRDSRRAPRKRHVATDGS